VSKLPLPLVFLFASLTCFGSTITSEDIKVFREHAELGNADAQYALGIAYGELNGGLGGVQEDNTEALKWYRKAAEQGLADAQNYLGVMYTYGEGVPKDYIVAYMWFNLAAAQGYENAKVNNGFISKRMSKEQIAEAQKLSREWVAQHY
jgi:TPR repeat protein